jgi:hypothetical protein
MCATFFHYPRFARPFSTMSALPFPQPLVLSQPQLSAVDGRPSAVTEAGDVLGLKCELLLFSRRRLTNHQRHIIKQP